MSRFLWHMLLVALSILVITEAELIQRDEAKCSKDKTLKECSWHYLAYFPRMFRSGVTENIMISTHGFPKSVSVNIRLTKQDDSDYTSVSKIVQPGQLSTIPLFVGHDASNRLKLHIEGLGEAIDGDSWLFKNTTDYIYVQKLGLNIMVQTDRPIYKPGQTIKFRVIVVDTDLKPFTGTLNKVQIENPSGSVMRQWREVDLVDSGYASFELKTSEKPVLGKWKITAHVKSYKKVLQVEVKKFVLPKFKVTISPPSFILVADTTVEAEICAKYSYGKSVIGQLTTTICARKDYGYRHWYQPISLDGKNRKCKTIKKRIDGCATITIPRDDFYPIKDEKSSSNNQLAISYDAKVKESITGIELEAEKVERKMQSVGYRLSFEKFDSFKPGFPLKTKLFVKDLDGKPADKVLVTLKVGTNYRKGDILDKKAVVTNGVFEIDVPIPPFKHNKIYLHANHERKPLYTGETQWRRRAEDSKSLTAWFSPSHSYLKIEKQFKGAAKIGSFVDVNVHYTSVDAGDIDRTVYYSTMCAGNIVDSGSFTKTFVNDATPQPTATTTTTTTTTTTASLATNITTEIYRSIFRLNNVPPTWPPVPSTLRKGSFKFSFDITKEMMPHCKMVVYYMRGEEMVADNTKFDVEDILENDVSIKFTSDEVKPGRSVQLNLKAAPNSKVAVTAVDTSIHFLAKGNDLKQKDLFDIRENLDISAGYVRSRWDRCPNPYGLRRKRSIIPYDDTEMVDSEKAFAEIGYEVLTNLRLDTRPCQRRRFGPPKIAYSLSGGPWRGQTTSTTMMPRLTTTTRIPVDATNSVNKKKPTHVRQNFPETWLWLDETVSNEGAKSIDVKVPDTITSWYASAFGISKSAGMGVAKATKIRVFQPFFISLNLPYSVIRGELLTVPAVVFNYMEDSCLSIRVSLERSLDFQMVAGPSAKTCLCGKRSAKILFKLIPKKLGQIPIRITAETLDHNICALSKNIDSTVSASDILVRKLRVEPEGVKNSYTLSEFICPRETPTTEFKLRRPENLVPGSIFSKVSVIGDIMGSSLSNIDELLAMPYGCGEQNMLKFAPNIFIMNYLNHTNQATGDITDKALGYMRSGYQRELTYKHSNGGYSAFGSRDTEASTWLTAFVLKSYAEARPWIDIDDKEIKHSSQWLLRAQSKDGCFPSIGSLHNKAMKGGVKTPATLTAYVTISLLEADVASFDTRLYAASKCVRKSLDDINDSYSLAIIAYMFAKLKDSQGYDQVMKRLNSMAIDEAGMKHWEESKDEDDENRSPNRWYYQARSTDIEQTAYVMLAMLEKRGKEAISDAIPIVRWLSKQRNGLGGWSSTQDTVLAMQALANFADLTYGSSMNMNIQMEDGKDTNEFEITSKNNLVLQQVEDIPVPSTLKIKASGDGCALLQAHVQYNEKHVLTKPSFAVRVEEATIKTGKLTPLKTCYSQQLTVCAKWLRKGVSNMAMIDVVMVSGFSPNEKSLNKAQWTTPGLKDVETKGKNVYFYFNRFENKETCVKFIVDQEQVVEKSKEVPIKVYDYYDTEKSATVMYGFNKEECKGEKHNFSLFP
ncbi:alpha-1-macroglobulin-like isoform X3 [Clytia hemisphaerica]|uniref:Uncharacterized protein n=1 Tax=Clytia hemisphaerica TaxID=252671 RepID=A0A7M5X3A2_9CNID